jgi:hypothetical protein
MQSQFAALANAGNVEWYEGQYLLVFFKISALQTSNLAFDWSRTDGTETRSTAMISAVSAFREVCLPPKFDSLARFL